MRSFEAACYLAGLARDLYVDRLLIVGVDLKGSPVDSPDCEQTECLSIIYMLKTIFV